TEEITCNEEEKTLLAAVVKQTTSNEFRNSQDADTSLNKWISYHKNNDSSFSPEELPSQDDPSIKLWFDNSGEIPRLLVPTDRQFEVFKVFHDPAHNGFKSTQKNISKNHYWPRLKSDVRAWCKNCVACQKNKVSKHTHSPITKLEIPSDRFACIHVDLVGPLHPPVNGKNTLFTIIDNYSGFMSAFPLYSS
ncbi:Hypothetical predicted protein, partial [Paramuricea clavata]